MNDQKFGGGELISFPGIGPDEGENALTAHQRAWLRRGLGQPGGKLPLFDEEGQLYAKQTVTACIAQGWAEPWFSNPIKPDWLVCRVTDAGRTVLGTVPKSYQKSFEDGSGLRRLTMDDSDNASG